ncbi:hypothetical protein HK105_201387 [Polyrhizophydium stewartii]|uniref:Ankyrin repeat protein n=1 Tax=Polyrhizophydium stewartii TaxID=2732419 RepID=A0ABR4NI26_9FUNG
MRTQKVVPTDPDAVAALAAVLARIDALEQQRTAQHAVRLTADTDHLADAISALRLEPAAAAPPAAPAPYRRINGFRPSATNEWDRMPAEVQHMILDAAGLFTQFVNGLLLRAELNGLSEQQQLQVWQDAIDSNWKGNIDPLPPLDTRSAALHIHDRGVLQRLRGRLGDLECARICIRNGWTDMLDDAKPDTLADAASLEGSVPLLMELIDARQAAKPSIRHVRLAARGGHLDAVKFLHWRKPLRDWDTGVAYNAAASGSTELLAWLHKHHRECFDIATVVNAANHNHMHAVRWLLENTASQGSAMTLARAAENDNMEMLELLFARWPTVLESTGRRLVATDVRVVAWLHERGVLDCNKLVRHAADKGCIAALEWAETYLGVVVTEQDLEGAHHDRHTRLLEWAYARGTAFTQMSAAWAVKACNIDLMRWLLACDCGVEPMLVEATASGGPVALVEWWRVRHDVVFGQQELEIAVRACNVPVSRHLLEMDGADWDLHAVSAVASRALLAVSPRLRSSIDDAIKAAQARRAARVAVAAAVI